MCSKNTTTSLLHAGITIATYLAGFPQNESLTTHIPGGRFTGPKPKNCIYIYTNIIYIYDVLYTDLSFFALEPKHCGCFLAFIHVLFLSFVLVPFYDAKKLEGASCLSLCHFGALF